MIIFILARLYRKLLVYYWQGRQTNIHFPSFRGTWETCKQDEWAFIWSQGHTDSSFHKLIRFMATSVQCFEAVAKLKWDFFFQYFEYADVDRWWSVYTAV